ncbi:MAG: hypothetical protein HKO95_00995 [Rhodobacteraceae bacterium]|jgi:hypothetical protein|nr:hypothetical protein [Alphaproteobacteria bacterium]NNK65293.1 hypothetical protein [Paracoccaceae bacterium]
MTKTTRNIANKPRQMALVAGATVSGAIAAVSSKNKTEQMQPTRRVLAMKAEILTFPTRRLPAKATATGTLKTAIVSLVDYKTKARVHRTLNGVFFMSASPVIGTLAAPSGFTAA